MKIKIAVATLALISAPALAHAGTVGGAVVGGVAGKVAGNHPVAGAVVGGAIGHHMAAKKKAAGK